jgi:hypothetical protein
VVFPKAAVLLNDRIIHEIYVDSYDSKDIRTVLEKDVEHLMQLYAVGAKQDVFEACTMVDEVSKSAPVDGLRFVQIHKNGLNLLRIHKIGNQEMERAAFIAMNEYKRNLLEELNRRTSNVMVAGMAVSFTLAGAKIGGFVDRLM